ncbi:acyltransferase-like protein chloroplastic [Dorcoceras hygrometricum]|uniref:Acyltransferase-like protein chloroplastic n=1 Tax=Dorcoceras hygrometricum TaxID=472368 RepID=A0A2Z7BAD3_9LAMI|nr:acyltransferase-like protein chloroplastic [Dorcoceras hygrometricum]
MYHTARKLCPSPMVSLTQEYKPCYPALLGPPHYYTNLSIKLWLHSRLSRVHFRGKKKDGTVLSAHGFVQEYDEGNLEENLRPLWDDGYGTQTVNQYLDAAKNMIQSDNGPPRWFCPVESGLPLKNSPVLLFLPGFVYMIFDQELETTHGIDGLGMGLIRHHKALGKVFEVRCLHVPVHDRTPYKGLVKFVEDVIRDEHRKNPTRPIYLVGESFGGSLALSVAANNPTIDLVLILVNPGTSFNRSHLNPLLPVLEALPEELQHVVPYIFGLVLGDPIRMAKVNKGESMNVPIKQLENFFYELRTLLAGASTLPDIIPKETLIWKMKLLKSAERHANSRLHAVEAEVLILASGKDSLFPSESEAQRLSNLIKNCKKRFLKDNGHSLLLEDGLNLLTVIKGSSTYRRSKRHDYVKDFLPPSMWEFKSIFDKSLGPFRLATSPVMLSTLGDGKIVRGLEGIPDQGPVLLVGYHMLLGTELGSIVEGFLREKTVMVHGVAHPEMFNQTYEGPLQDTSDFDMFRVFGAIPVTASNIFKLLSTKSYVLLYPGGVREALHRKGESYKLFWPEEPEFVRMAIRFGATIVPFGVVGADDVVELFLDYDELMRIPFVKDMIKLNNINATRVRPGVQMEGELANQDFFFPGILPKLPGRFYCLFGKPLVTKGREEMLKDKSSVKEFYQQIKSDVQGSIAYLLKKREEDPYRNLFQRMLYRVVSAPVHQLPTFDL